MALIPEHRGQGLGSRLISLAKERARAEGLMGVSLIAFEENAGSVRLYRREGFREVDRRAVVPHELIRYGGDALLMLAD
jgi:ribosomal protein S18 acetylase RimI-like enzyme